ncbi:MAG TPA: DUF5687 family protein [Bacteroidales bacterium]|nr:DUF5687 family protein [Bacteroidales bacterium]HOX78721.1 DUF5687 family protein [Bacteroidales bacterium]HPM93824.1 DUF5687 family protein [Bacteroidales bacterium]
MLFRIFLDHQWKEYRRSPVWQRNMVANIFVGFFSFLMIVYLLMIGFFLGPLLSEIMPDSDPVAIINGIILYFLGFDLLIRYLMQALPTFAIESYLHLPVRKSSMVHFVISKSLFHLLNFLPLLVFIPFAARTILPSHGGAASVAWIVSILFLVISNNFLATYLKRILVSRPVITLLAGIVMIGLAAMDIYGLIRLSDISASAMGAVLKNPFLAILPVILAFLMYALNYFYLKSKVYPDEVIRHKTIQVQDIPRIKYLNSMGLTGDLIMLDIKLWWRHKRTKTMLYMFPIFVLYGLFFYPNPIYRNDFSWLIFVGTFMTGGMTMNYLNYAFGYESNHFDGLLTSRVNMDLYIRAKLTIGMLITTFCFIITIPYFLFSMDILLINFVAFLFNLGFLSYLLLYMATFNKKRMDLAKGSSFNYQGVGLMNWLVLIPAFVLPLIIFAPFNLTGNRYTGLAAIGLLGILGLISRRFWVKMIEKGFYARKYTMAEGFRE